MGSRNINIINKSYKTKNTWKTKKKFLSHLKTKSRLLYFGIKIESFYLRTTNQAKKTLNISCIKTASQKNITEKINWKTVKQTKDGHDLRLDDLLKRENYDWGSVFKWFLASKALWQTFYKLISLLLGAWCSDQQFDIDYWK
jgi:hypothetical protein